jgi:NADPH:quinone reductase-like Zn-dependent oxidoreductase
MNAVTYRRFGSPDVLELVDIPSPHPAAGQLLVRVRAASVNPLDGKIRRGELRLLSGSRFPKTPGMDYAGVVEAVGSGVIGFAVGDRVFGFSGSMRHGTLAERIAVPATTAAKLPAGLELTGAAALATVGLAALQTVRDVARIAAGERVLVNGATGGVGLVMLQLLRRRGAEVTAVAATSGVELARVYGAHDVIDYRVSSVRASPERFDAVLDTSTKLPFRAARSLLAPRGRYVGFEPTPATLLASKLANLFRRQQHLTLITKPSSRDLAELAQLVVTGALRVPPIESFELPDARRAFARVEGGGVLGKVVIHLP